MQHNNLTTRLKFKPTFLAVLATLTSATTLVPNIANAADKAPTETVIQLPPVPLTGNPLGVASDQLVIPVSVLNGRELSLNRGATIGETLNGIPGVSQTSFGPNASRPVIRGLDAERVRILQNGVGILDASSLSFDHAVAIDPLVIEQIDVIRGPASLLYGGSAVGGVVNAIDHRIPREKLNGVTGRAEARVGGPDSQNSVAGVIDAGNGRFAIHGDVFSRKTSDLDIPDFAVSRRKAAKDGIARENRGRLNNSSAESDGGAIGASLTFDNGYIGASFSTLDSNYGVVAKEGVRIDMRSNRWDLASEFTDLGNVINRVKFRMAYTDYKHDEVKLGEVDTSFANRGIEGSFEAGHAPINTGVGTLQGTVGLQFQNTHFSALGHEAFVPNNTTQTKALYVYEELPILATNNKLKLTAGARFGHTSVDKSASEHFGPAENRSFNPNSYAMGSLYQFNDNWTLAGNVSHNERAPSHFELYANGIHAATGQFEVGNSQFDVERSKGIDAQIRWKKDAHSFSVGAYYTRFSNFIGLFDTGRMSGDDDHDDHDDDDDHDDHHDHHDESLPIAQFGNVAAVIKGLETEGRFNVANHLDLTMRGDYVHATDRDTGRPLPRIAPLRLGAGLIYQNSQFGARVNVMRAFNQGRTATQELATDGYTDVSAMVTYKLPTKTNWELFARANNLLNEEIREHSSFLKDLSMQGRRSVMLGLRSDF